MLTPPKWHLVKRLLSGMASPLGAALHTTSSDLGFNSHVTLGMLEERVGLVFCITDDYFLREPVPLLHHWAAFESQTCIGSSSHMVPLPEHILS